MSVYLDKLLLFGDSITQLSADTEFGYPLSAALQSEYQRKLDVITRGFGGYNSDHGKLILPHVIEEENKGTGKIKIVVIFFGSNDSVGENDIQYVPLDRYKDNLKEMVKIAESKDVKVILVGPGLHDEYLWPEKPNTRNTLRNLEYCNAVKEVASQVGVPFIDLWHGMLEDMGWKEGEPIIGQLPESSQDPERLKKCHEYLPDGLHFGGPGYKVYFNGIIKAIKTAYPELQAEKLPELLPNWAIVCKDIEALKKALGN